MQGYRAYKKQEIVFMAPSHKRNESVCIASQTPHTPGTAELCTTGVQRCIYHQITKIHSTSCW